MRAACDRWSPCSPCPAPLPPPGIFGPGRPPRLEPPPVRAPGAPCLSGQSGSTLTRSGLGRPEEPAGHAVADQRVEALCLDALRGGRPVPAPPAPRRPPHAARAAHPAGTETGLPAGGGDLGEGGAPPTAPRPAARWVGPLSAGAPGTAPRPSLSICGSSIQPLNHPAGASPAGPCWALGRGCGSGQACSWQQRMGPPGQGTDVWGPSLSCPQGQPKGPGDPRQRSPPLGAILPSQAVLVQVIKHLSAALYPPPRDGGAGGGGDRTGETPRSRSSPQRVRKALWRR